MFVMSAAYPKTPAMSRKLVSLIILTYIPLIPLSATIYRPEVCGASVAEESRGAAPGAVFRPLPVPAEADGI